MRARSSFSAQRKKDSRKLSFFCAFRGRVRDHIDNPSKPPFKFTSLLFVATARKNKFICSSLALIATLIREASLGAKNETCYERSQVAPCQGVRGGVNKSSREMPANASSSFVFRSKSKGLEKSEPFLFLGFLTRKRLLMHLWQVFVLSTERHNEHSRNLNIIKTIIHFG